MYIVSSYTGREIPLSEVLQMVGPGWSDLLVKLINDLETLGWDGRLSQVKEKFGGLRFYVETSNDAIFNRILLAEEESLRTCEVCGSPGKQRDGGWIRTLCDEHSKERR